MFRFRLSKLFFIILAATLVLSLSSAARAQDATSEASPYQSAWMLFEYQGEIYVWDYVNARTLNLTDNVLQPASKPRWGGFDNQLISFEADAGVLSGGKTFKVVGYMTIEAREPHYISMCLKGDFQCGNAQINSAGSFIAFSAVRRSDGLPFEYLYDLWDGSITLVQKGNFLPDAYRNGWTADNVLSLVGTFEGDKLIRRNFIFLNYTSTFDGTHVDDSEIGKETMSYFGCNDETFEKTVDFDGSPMFHLYRFGDMMLAQSGTPAEGNPWRDCDAPPLE